MDKLKENGSTTPRMKREPFCFIGQEPYVIDAI